MNRTAKTALGFVAALLASAALFTSVALAADLPLPPPKAKPERALPAQQPSEFERLANDCIEASNGCQRFVRAADGKFDALNNTGIACQPQPLSCTKRK